MMGVRPHEVPLFVKRDVEKIRNEARFIYQLPKLKLFENPRPRLNVIAVIGPGSHNGQSFQEALLLEIGLSRAKPYNQTNKPRHLVPPGETLCITKRLKFCSLNEEQYQAVGPLIFAKLEELARTQVENRKCGPCNPYYLPMPRHYFSRHRKTLFNVVSNQPLPSSAAFSVSLKDEFFVSDVFWAELNQNKALRYHLSGLARFIDLYLSVYKNGFKNDFASLRRVSVVWQKLWSSSLSRSPYLFAEILNYLPRKERNALWPHLAGIFQSGRDDQTRERRIASQVLCDPPSRLGNIQLRVTTGLNGKNRYRDFPKKRNHIVFEIFPNF